MNILAIVQAFFFFGYVAYLWIKLGVIKSISESWYALAPFKKSQLFNVFAAGVSLPMWMFELYIDNGFAQLFFAASAFFMFGLSIASTFKTDKMVSSIHYGCTLFAIGFAILGIKSEFNDPYFWHMFGATAIGTILIALLCKNKIWWIEIFVFTLIIARLILN